MGATAGAAAGSGPPTDLRLDAGVVAKAVEALEVDAGCRRERAQQLVRAIARAAADESLELAAGVATVYGSVVDARVARLQRLIGALPDREPVPSEYEVGAIFRITTTQARSVLRTYEARYAAAHRARMSRVLSAVTPEPITEEGGTDVWRFEFDDPTILEHAVGELRRCGLARGIAVDRQALTLTVARGERDRHRRNAAEVLRGTPVS